MSRTVSSALRCFSKSSKTLIRSPLLFPRNSIAFLRPIPITVVCRCPSPSQSRFIHSSPIPDLKDPQAGYLSHQLAVDALINDTYLKLPSHPSPQTLEHIAEELITTTPDFRTIINYKTLIETLEDTGYFANATIWHIYITYYRPFIKTAKKEHYNMRVTKFLEVLQFIADKELTGVLKEGELHQLKQLLYPDLVDTIKYAISMGDLEFIDDLLDVIRLQYESLHTEDWHTFLITALESSNDHVVKRLVFGDFSYERPTMSTSEEELVKTQLANSGLGEELSKLWKPNTIMKSYDASLLIQAFNELDLKDSFELLRLLTPFIESPVFTKDFKFITDRIIKDLETNSIQRKKFIERDPKSFRKHSKLNIQKIDIEQTLSSYGILRSTSINNISHSLFANLFLMAVSSITNNTGVIYSYTKIPRLLLNEESFEILFNSCAKGDGNQLRSLELFKFATDDLHLSLNHRCFEFLVESSLFGSDSQLLVFYLEAYFRIFDELTPKMEFLLFLKSSEPTTTVKKQLSNLMFFLSELHNSKDTKEFVRNTYTTLGFDPSLIKSSKYDVTESQMLQRLHKETFISQ